MLRAADQARRNGICWVILASSILVFKLVCNRTVTYNTLHGLGSLEYLQRCVGRVRQVDQSEELFYL